MTTAEADKDMIALRLSAADKAELEMLAAERDRTLSAEVRLAIKAHLKEARNVGRQASPQEPPPHA
jgi:citrate lyase beta subunit